MMRIFKSEKAQYLFALCGAPVLWLGQVNGSDALAARACFPHERALERPLWDGLPLMLLLVAAVSVTGGVCAALVALRLWRRHGKSMEDSLRGFASRLALVTSFIFAMAIFYTACVLLLVSPCAPWGDFS
jgi:hypothetical protein